MLNKKLKMPVMFEKIDDVISDDIRFTKVKVWLLHLGLNENACELTKEVVDEALPSLQYIPISGYIENKFGEEDYSDHRYKKVRDEEGNYRRKYLGQAYGVILSNEDNDAHYEERVCDDGETRTFLVANGIIWNHFEDGADIINRDMIKNHSMELVDVDDEKYLDGYEDENGIFHFTKITFRGACILGDEVEPAMRNSTVEVVTEFSLCKLIEEMQDDIINKITAFSEIEKVNKNKGETKQMADISKVKDVNGLETSTTVVDDNVSKVEPTTDFSQTVMEQFEDISQIVASHETYVDRWGDTEPRYRVKDIQDDMVVAVDRKEHCIMVGFAYTIEGDKPVIDFGNAFRIKTTYTKYEEGETVIEQNPSLFDFGKHIEEIENASEEKINAINTEFEKVKAELEEIKPKYLEFEKAEQERIAKSIEDEKNTLFAKFDAHLSDMEEYVELKNKSAELTVDEINNKCSIMFTKKNLSATTDFAKANTSCEVDIPVIDEVEENYIHTKYGDIPKKR